MVDTLLSSVRNQNHSHHTKTGRHAQRAPGQNVCGLFAYICFDRKDSLDYIWRMYTKLPFYSPSNRNSLKTEAKTFKDIFL